MLSFKNYALKCIKSNTSPYSIYKQAKILQKLMGLDLNKKKKKLEKSKKIMSESFPLGGDNICTKRMNVLNKTLMLNISEILASGEKSSKLIEFNIQITKVNIDKTFQNLKIYWVAGGKKFDDEMLGKILKSAAEEIQFEINSQRLMGRSPEILFVRDVTTENQNKIEQIFNSWNLLKNDENVPVLEKNNFVKIPSQVVKHDSFGLNHSEIMNKIKIEMKQSKLHNFNVQKEVLTAANKNNDNIIPFSKSDFLKFHQSHRNLLKKKNSKKFDTNYLDEE